MWSSLCLTSLIPPIPQSYFTSSPTTPWHHRHLFSLSLSPSPHPHTLISPYSNHFVHSHVASSHFSFPQHGNCWTLMCSIVVVLQGNAIVVQVLSGATWVNFEKKSTNNLDVAFGRWNIQEFLFFYYCYNV